MSSSTVILKFIGVSSTLLCRGLIKSQVVWSRAEFIASTKRLELSGLYNNAVMFPHSCRDSVFHVAFLQLKFVRELMWIEPYKLLFIRGLQDMGLYLHRSLVQQLNLPYTDHICFLVVYTSNLQQQRSRYGCRKTQICEYWWIFFCDCCGRQELLQGSRL